MRNPMIIDGLLVGWKPYGFSYAQTVIYEPEDRPWRRLLGFRWRRSSPEGFGGSTFLGMAHASKSGVEACYARDIAKYKSWRNSWRLPVGKEVKHGD